MQVDALQILMDGPYVIWSFLKLLKEEVYSDPKDSQLLELSSCGLHVIHGAFQSGHDEVHWNVYQVLSISRQLAYALIRDFH